MVSKLEGQDLESMSTKDLITLNIDFGNSRDALRTRQLEIKAVLEKRTAEDKIKAHLESLNDAEKEALKTALNAG